jgi:uncharacterized Zn finger protein
LAEAWLNILGEFDASSRQRIARGRGLARGGRVRDLWFSPGLANAEVVERENRHVSLRVRVFEESTWRKVVKLLRSRLDFVAALLEGELPRELVDTFAENKLSLLPSVDEFDGDCDCGDYALPCPHMAAVHVLLADALDGDPFLLLTLRGRPREQVLAALRSSWGDQQPLRLSRSSQVEAVPDASEEWYTSPTVLDTMNFHPMVDMARVPTGLRELGPPPGREDIERALTPLLQTGADLAEAIALQEAPNANRRGFLSATTDMAPRRAIDASTDPGDASLTFSLPVAGAIEDVDDDELVEALVDVLADGEGYRAREVAENLGVDLSVVRRELRKLEAQGAVNRTGRTRGTRWWLA